MRKINKANFNDIKKPGGCQVFFILIQKSSTWKYNMQLSISNMSMFCESSTGDASGTP